MTWKPLSWILIERYDSSHQCRILDFSYHSIYEKIFNIHVEILHPCLSLLLTPSQVLILPTSMPHAILGSMKLFIPSIAFQSIS